jgi:hypothetical protein
MVGLAWAGLEGESSSGRRIAEFVSTLRPAAAASLGIAPHSTSSGQDQIQGAAPLLRLHPAAAPPLHPDPTVAREFGGRFPPHLGRAAQFAPPIRSISGCHGRRSSTEACRFCRNTPLLAVDLVD